jgi:hypothetical protein
MKCVILAEDITLAVQQQQDWASPGGVGPMAETMIMGQKYGLSVIVVCHSLSGLGTLISRNIEAWIVTRFQAEDPRLIGNVLGLTPEQVEQMRTLRPGEFVCFNPVLWPKPVYATFLLPVIPGVCDEPMRKALVEGFLAAVTAKPPLPMEVFRPQAVPSTTSQEKNTGGKELASEQIEMLVLIASGLPKTAGKVYEAMGLNRAQCGKIAKALEAVGAIAAHRFSTGRLGGQLCFFEVLPYGWTILQARGISKPAPLTNGDFEHELGAQLLKADAIRNDFAIQFEVDLGGLRADGVMTNKKTGQKICVNIGISKPDHEVDSIQKFFTLPVSQNAKFVLVARDVTFVKEVKKILKARRIADAAVKQVNLRMIANLVKE